MATAGSWPLELPGPLVSTFNETQPDTNIRTNMDAGPAKVRRRFVAGVGEMTFQILLKGDEQKAVFKSFYENTLKHGSLTFDFDNPRSGESVVCRFKSPPRWESVSHDKWRVSIQLETLPS